MDPDGRAEVYMREKKKERKIKNSYSMKSHRIQKATENVQGRAAET